MIWPPQERRVVAHIPDNSTAGPGLVRDNFGTVWKIVDPWAPSISTATAGVRYATLTPDGMIIE